MEWENVRKWNGRMCKEGIKESREADSEILKM